MGGNTSLGYSGSFNVNFYCRNCIQSKQACKFQTKDDKTKYRTEETYEKTVASIASLHNVNLSKTKGINRSCALNNLQFFHIIDNFTCDLTHDFLEGTVPHLVSNFIKFGMINGVFREQKVINKCIYYDYGILNDSFKPTDIRLERKNLGQTASSNKCLILNLPFILVEFRQNEKIKSAWKCINLMLSILTIVYSSTIYEEDLQRLENYVSRFLSGIMECFGVELLPKHHFMTHMANIIKKVGPVIHMSTMRYENKHKTFTDYVRKTKNFVNVSKSLALKYQKYTVNNIPYMDNIKCGPHKVINSNDLPRIYRKYSTKLFLFS